MKKTLYTILAVLSIATAMSFVSCVKETPTPKEEKTMETPVTPVIEEAVTPKLDLEDGAEYFAYVGKPITIPFEAKEGDIDVADVNVNQAVPDCDFSVTYDKSTGKGTITVTLPESKAHSTSILEVMVFGGKEIYTYTIKVTAYFLDITAEGTMVFSGEAGESKDIEYTVDTNLEDYSVEITTEANWLKIENGKAVLVEENYSGEVRTGKITLKDKDCIFEPATIAVIVNYLEELPKENMVYFSDRNFKKACLAVADSDNDGEVSYDEALAVKELNIAGKGIENLNGLEYFKNVWKLDAQNNDIRDASCLNELKYLYWLDLKGNKNLKTFNVRECSHYFEHCQFDITEDLVWYSHDRQVNVEVDSDFYMTHNCHDFDRRESDPASPQDNLVLYHRHTKGDGMLGYVFTGTAGYIDIDIKDGTYARLMKECIELARNAHPDFGDYWDYIDVYYMEHYCANRYEIDEWDYEDIWTPYVNENLFNIWENEYLTTIIKSANSVREIENVPNKIIMGIVINTVPNPRQSGCAAAFDNVPLANKTYNARYELATHCHSKNYYWNIRTRKPSKVFSENFEGVTIFSELLEYAGIR